jgi:hypothetical protein
VGVNTLMGHLKASSGWRVWPVVATNASGADGFGWHEEEERADRCGPHVSERKERKCFSDRRIQE